MDFSKITILLVDDVAEIRESIRAVLTEFGAQEILEAPNGKEALDTLHHQESLGHSVHLIISDWQMPVLDGIGLLAELKVKDNFLDIPIIMISGEYGDREKALGAKKLGAHRCLAKPFNCMTLMEVINHVLIDVQILDAFRSMLLEKF